MPVQLVKLVHCVVALQQRKFGEVMKTKKKAKLTEKEKLLKQLAEIEATKNKLAELRDKLRGQVSDLEDILESLETGIDQFDDAHRLFSDGLDTLSQYV